MQQKKLSRKKAKHKLKQAQRHSNRQYGTWDRISTRSMHQGKENNTQHTTVNNVTNNEKRNKDQNIEPQQQTEETKTPILNYNQQTKPSHNKENYQGSFYSLLEVLDHKILYLTLEPK